LGTFWNPRRIRHRTEIENNRKEIVMKQKPEYTTLKVSWVDGMSFWLDVLQKHLKESAHKPSDVYGGLSFADYFEEQVYKIADATDRANRVVEAQEKKEDK